MPTPSKNARQPLSTLVVGAGQVGRRRAHVAASYPGTRLLCVCDVDTDRARSLAEELSVAHGADWRAAVDRHRPELVVVSTPPAQHLAVTEAALAAGCHVLVEKPFGRDLAEAERMTTAAATAGVTLAVGFQLRFQPAFRSLRRQVLGGTLGRILFVRCVYGHGGRPGYEREWRADPRTAGGGELRDQGVHLLDLLHALLGPPVRAHAELGQLAWRSAVEDNAFATLRWADGCVASAHASWSQWRNRFQLQVYGERGALEWDGLGGSYGVPTLRRFDRVARGGAPSEDVRVFRGADVSWTEQWADFVTAVEARRPPENDAEQGLAVLRVADALYRSADSGRSEAV